MAAWAVFVLLAGGLAGYVVVYSDSAEVPGENAQEQSAGKDEESTKEPAVAAASKPSLAVAGEKTEPTTEADENERHPAETRAAPDDESGSQQHAQTPPGEAPQAADTPTGDQTVGEEAVEQAESSSEAASQDVMKQVASTAKVNGQELPEPETDREAPSSSRTTETSAPPKVPDQVVNQDVKPETAEEPSATAATTEETSAAKKAEGETQVAFRAPAPAPTTEETPPWQRYAAYFLDEDTRPRVAIIMTGLGMSDGITEAAIKSLPPEVTLSFSPYARNLAGWIGLARVNGHEVLLDLYMEPSTYPLDDPGPQAIMTVLSEEENRSRLNWVLSRGNSYVGLTGRLGSRLLTRRRSLSPVMNEIAEQGLVFIDDRATAGSLGYGMAQDLDIPTAYSEGLIDEPSANRTAIDAKLNRIERIALTKGAAVALAQPYPVTIERLNAWIEELPSRGVALAPITAVVNRQPPIR